VALPVYEQLGDAVSLRAAGILKCREFYALLGELFTPEEAELAAKMPLRPVSADGFAAELGRDPQQVKALLESMANKAVVFSFSRGDVTFYNLMGLVPGMFDSQFTRGEFNERDYRLARLFQDYFNARRDAAKEALSLSIFPFARVITVEKEIPAGVAIHPYDQLSQYIANSEYIALSTCFCRHFGELVGRPCDKPNDVCLSLGLGARFIAERGLGKLISKEEALKALERAEKAGLVHCSSNTAKYLEFICNCCVCHCGIVQGLKNAASPSAAATSGFIAAIDDGQCMGCGDCIDRCPMDALSMQDDIALRDANRCIGCGLCISVCSTGALQLEAREGAPVPPLESKALNAAIMESVWKKPQ